MFRLGSRFNPLTGEIELVENNAINPRNQAVIFDDYINRTGTQGYLGWLNANTGGTWTTGAVASPTVDALGVYRNQVVHSAANTSNAVTHIGSVGHVRVTGGTITLEARVRITAPPAQITSRQMWVGFQDTTTVTPTSAILMGFTSPNNSWNLRTVAGGVTNTTTTTTSAVANDTWTVLRYEVNSAANLVTLWVNGTQITTTATLIPTSAQNMWPVFWFQSVSNAASTAHQAFIDFYILRKTFSPFRFSF